MTRLGSARVSISRFWGPRLCSGARHLVAVTTTATVAGLFVAMPAFAAPKAGASPKALAASSGPTYPTTPPAQICGSGILTNPGPAPTGPLVVQVPVGDNNAPGPSHVDWNQPGHIFYFASGAHTLGTGIYSQIISVAGATYVGAPNAVIEGQGLNAYAFTTKVSGVTVKYLTVQNFIAPQDEGVVNHDSGDHWSVQYNTIKNNQGAALMIGPDNSVTYNCLQNNGQYGFNAYASQGNSNITLSYNEIAGNDTLLWNTDPLHAACGCFGGGKLWAVMTGQVTNNWVHDNHGPGIWADTNNAGILIDGNYIADNDDEAIFYEASYNGRITNNNIVRNGYVAGRYNANQGLTFPVPSIYISESGGDSRVGGGLYSNFEITANSLVDNWGGVLLWENADRFCGADGNPTALCTLVAANPSQCAPPPNGSINIQPYLSDCRWKTQNVSVHDNTFSFNNANVSCSSANCDGQGILASAGSTPSWSPYLGNVVPTAITTQQNNHFANNTYLGTWKFIWPGVPLLTFTQWQGSPFSQDAGSTLNGITYPTPPPGNLIDADTATLEGGPGFWANWFSTAAAQSTAQAFAGTHSLQVGVTAPYGWGIQTSNWPGFVATPGPQTMSFAGLLGSGTLGADMQVQWRDGTTNHNVLGTNDITIPTLTGTWQQASANVTAPSGTTSFTVTITSTPGGSGVTGNSLYLDQIFVGTPQPVGVNALDADTASLEASIGHWTPWVSTTIARTTAQAQAGTHSLQVNITAPNGRGIELNNWPGFATTPGQRTVSFWARAGTGTNLRINMQAQWLSGANPPVLLGTTNVSSANPLTSTWQQFTTTATAPAGTATVLVNFTSISGAAGTAGNNLYIDTIYVGT